MESQRNSECYPGPFSNRHKYKYRKMLVTFCSDNKKNTINAALDLLSYSGFKVDESTVEELNNIYDNKFFYKDFYILPFYRAKHSVKAYLESLLFTDEVILFENEKKFVNQNFIDACSLFDIPIRFIDIDSSCNAYRVISNAKLLIGQDIERITDLRQTLASEDYKRYKNIEIDVDYTSTAFWHKGSNISKNVLYVGLPQLLYRRIYEWADAYWCFVGEEIDDDFIDNYYDESEWIYNELKSRIGKYVNITLSKNF